MRSDTTDNAQVEIDGGYVRGRPKQRKVAVQTYDEKPKHRLFELLKRQGMQPNEQVDFLSDGSEDVRNLQLSLNPQAEHLLGPISSHDGIDCIEPDCQGTTREAQ